MYIKYERLGSWLPVDVVNRGASLLLRRSFSVVRARQGIVVAYLEVTIRGNCDTPRFPHTVYLTIITWIEKKKSGIKDDLTTIKMDGMLMWDWINFFFCFCFLGILKFHLIFLTYLCIFLQNFFIFQFSSKSVGKVNDGAAIIVHSLFNVAQEKVCTCKQRP